MTGITPSADRPDGGSDRETSHAGRSTGYWRANRRLQITLLAIWALFGYVLAIIFADQLNELEIGGFPLGFWFAQQGAIYVFVILIFVYAFTMDRVDREYEFDEGELGFARRRAEQRMQEELTSEAPAEQSEREVRRDD